MTKSRVDVLFWSFSVWMEDAVPNGEEAWEAW